MFDKMSASLLGNEPLYVTEEEAKYTTSQLNYAQLILKLLNGRLHGNAKADFHFTVNADAKITHVDLNFGAPVKFLLLKQSHR